MRTSLLLASLYLTTGGVLLTPNASAAVPDGLPLIDWEGQHLPVLPAACRPLGEAALGAARAWAGKAGLGAWDPAQAARSTTAFHVIGWALPRAPGLPPEPAATGWWATDPNQVAAASPLIGGWPDQPTMVTNGRLNLTHPRTQVVGETTVDGMRLRIHGEALAACLQPLVEPKPAWQPILATIASWHLETTIRPDGTCQLDTGIPHRFLAPVNPDAIGRLPEAQLTVALGVAPTADPMLLPGGTWACSWNGDAHLVIAIPEGDHVRDWLLGLTHQVPVNHGEVLALADVGPWLQRGDGGWRLAFVREDLDAPVRGMPTTDATATPLGQLQWSTMPATIDPTVQLQPWPFSNLESLPSSSTREVTFLANADGHAVLSTQDPVMTWLLPTLALRWFADEVADQHGMAKLRRGLTRLRAAGIPITREELQATQPVVPDAAGWIDRAKTWDHPVDTPDANVMKEALASTKLPLAVATPDQLQAARDYGAEIAPLWTLSAERIASLPWQGTPLSVPPAGILMTFLTPLRQAARSGLLLVQHGDARGLPLVDAARASLGRPATLVEALMLISVHALRDQAWLTATIQGLGDPTPWIAEPYRVEEEGRTAWAGERVMIGWGAKAWLEVPQQATSALPQGARWFGRHPLVSSHDRTSTAADLADYLDQLALPTGWVMNLDPAQRHLRHDFLAAMDMIRTQLVVGGIRHHLTRLAGAIVLQARRQPLPEDPANLGLALSIPGPTGPLPCTWQRLGRTSFRLTLDVHGPLPAGIPAQRWEQWQQGTLPDTQEALVNIMTPPLIQVHQSTLPQTPNPHF